ncbi:hypothetical protein [Robertkochia sediminum]|uniref:hypothetical protein n=1 Tax=Robertkochia sediminum TaxID=2785326 RepID=UPI001932E330|nr:hypothetical protein [Robertkochia sediminum]MBL7471399.1 hypothetical protein [Robertkochia sediminum]
MITTTIQETGITMSRHFGPLHPDAQLKTLFSVDMEIQAIELVTIEVSWVVTDDGYLQLVHRVMDWPDTPHIVAQERLNDLPEVTQALQLWGVYVRGTKGFYRITRFCHPGVAQKEDYEQVLQGLEAEARADQEFWEQHPLYQKLKSAGIHAISVSGSKRVLMVKCPRGNHHMYIEADKATWTCGYCCKRGEVNALMQS